MSSAEAPTGVVFDIQRGSTDDGPGIRTTVFLKGCPLRCAWCHNPESWSPMPELMADAGRCIGCGVCEAACPRGVHSFPGGERRLDRAACVRCGRCAEVCPTGALRLAGKTMDVEQVLAVVLRDRPYYETSRGGLTVSGGEPLMQFPFLRALLRAAKDRGLHVCLETSGYGDAGELRELLPLVDIFLYDWKLTEDAEHRRWTGVPNGLILQNLDLLCRAGATVWLRCPMIPGVNDREEHIRAVAELAGKYLAIRRVELMPYHDLGRGKWDRLGRSYGLGELRIPDREEKRAVLERFRRAGCEKVFMKGIGEQI